MTNGFTHLDASGKAHMVDVTLKASTQRSARAHSVVRLTAGDAGACDWDQAFAAARIAGTQAAKRTALLIPLCHQLLAVDVEMQFDRYVDRIEVSALATVHERTGVEMEALVAVSAAALSLSMHTQSPRIDDTMLVEKSGGKSGRWLRTALRSRDQ